MIQNETNTLERVPNKAVRLSKKQLKAAQLVAEDVLIDEKIAESCKIGRATLMRWKNQPVFAARVALIEQEYADRIMKSGRSRKEVRVAEYNWGADLIRARIEKHVAANEEVPMSLLRELRDTCDQIAVELGQKVSKHELDARVGVFVINRVLVGQEPPKKEPE